LANRSVRIFKRSQLLSMLVPLLVASVASCTGDDANEGPQFSTLPDVAGLGSAEPHLATTTDGTVVMSWLEPSEPGTDLRWSRLHGDQWEDPRSVASGGNWFVNWADFPSVEPISESLWAAHWLVKRPGGTFAYDVAISISKDAGSTWTEAVIPHQDDTPTEHGFVSLFPWQDKIGALWLDGRNMQPSDDGHGHGGMTLRAVALAGDLARHRKTEVDGLVCDCCQTDVAIGASGPIAVYRNRTEEEVRDIYVTRLLDGEWLPGVAVADDDWTIAGCPVNGPAVDAAMDDVAVAWFTAANGDSKVRLARSSDSGASFSAALDIAVDRPVGRVDVALLADGSALVSWLESAADGTGDIRVRRATLQGVLGPAHTVAKTDAGRMSGFPQMVVSGDQVVFAWTDVADGVTSVRTAKAAVKGLISN